jgi:serine/threonine protein kinase
MGAVYEAHDPQSGRTVAIKTLPRNLASSETVRRRFQSEIDVLMNLRHPGISQMIAFGQENGVPFFAMEFVPGHSLEELLRAGRRFSWRDTVAIAREMLPALKFAHDHGVVHRDLKPANLMFPPAPGGGYHVKLTDFGIAKVFGDGGQTRSGLVIGTPEYMAPEQAAGQPVDHRADLYSLGLVMVAMMTGLPPFTGGDVEEVMHRQRTQPAPRLTSTVPDAPPALDDLIALLLDKSPANRPANAAIVARALAEIAAAPAAPSPQPPPSPVTQPMTGGRGRPRGVATVRGAAAASPQGTTIALDDADVANRLIEDDQPAGRSTFTTVESLARDRRAREAQAQRLKTVGGGTLAIATTLLLAWLGYQVVVPMIWPSEQARWSEILDVLGNPDDLRDPCGLIRNYLDAYPNGAHAENVRRLGDQLALERLAKRSRRRLPTYAAKSDAERLYLDGVRLTDTDPVEAKRSLTRLVGLANAAASEVASDPCAAVEKPSVAMWRDLARRQLALVEPLIHEDRSIEREEKQAEVDRAKSMLEQAARYQQEVDTTTDATRRVIAITWRHRLLEDLVDAFADKPHVADAVAEARRLLAAQR